MNTESYRRNRNDVIHIHASAPSMAEAKIVPPPPSTTSLPFPDRPKYMNDVQMESLKKQGFTTGLARSIFNNCEDFPVRFWVVDNSGSMNTPDGHRIVETRTENDVRTVDCTRWEEIKECVNYHSNLAALLYAPTVFRLLNNPGARVGSQEFSVAEYNLDSVNEEQYQARTIMNKASPQGFTPLRDHIIAMGNIVRTITPVLQKNGQKAVIILATDGKPTDESGYSTDYITDSFVQALRDLQGLPIWVVIRLCTDEEDVVEFYNNLDDNLELSIEVLDDYVGEAEEVYAENPWLNYGLPLHRMRENGYNERVFDLIDERPLTKSELRQFCVALYGEQNFDGVPDPNIDWMGFVATIDRFNRQEKNTYNPIKKKVLPWVDTKMLNSMYGDGGCACTIM